MYFYYSFISVCVFPIIFCEDKLIHIHAVWRHGERNPAKTFNGDLNNVSAFPEGFTQLTKKGIHQLYTLGQHFQARYINDFEFISPNYINSEIYVRSTDADRAIVSAMAFFSGFYSNLSSTDHILAPVPIHTIPASNDFLNIFSFECPKKDKLWKMVDKSKTIKSLLNNSNEILAVVSNKTKIPLNFIEIMYVFDTAIFETYLGLPLPPWLISLMPEFEVLFVNYIAALWGFIPFKEDSFEIDLQKELTIISSGPLIDEIVDRLILKIECQKSKTKNNCEGIEKQKFYVYSGHDITEISLLLGLGFKTFIFEKESMPAVGSSIVLELWKSEDIKNVSFSKVNQFEFFYVKIYYYQNSSVENPKYIGDLLPECQGEKGCPISYLIKRAELLRPKPDLKRPKIKRAYPYYHDFIRQNTSAKEQNNSTNEIFARNKSASINNSTSYNDSFNNDHMVIPISSINGPPKKSISKKAGRPSIYKNEEQRKIAKIQNLKEYNERLKSQYEDLKTEIMDTESKNQDLSVYAENLKNKLASTCFEKFGLHFQQLQDLFKKVNANLKKSVPEAFPNVNAAEIKNKPQNNLTSKNSATMKSQTVNNKKQNLIERRKKQKNAIQRLREKQKMEIQVLKILQEKNNLLHCLIQKQVEFIKFVEELLSISKPPTENIQIDNDVSKIENISSKYMLTSAMSDRGKTATTKKLDNSKKANYGPP